MREDEFRELFARVRGFGWREKKRADNLRDHKIDFEDAKSVFQGYTFVRRSDQKGEVRYQLFGQVHGREIAVTCTFRGDLCWIISARPASRKERREYYHRLTGRSPTRED